MANAAQHLYARIFGLKSVDEVPVMPPKDGSRPTKYRNSKQKRRLLASTYHQNPARTYAEALADDAKRMAVQS